MPRKLTDRERALKLIGFPTVRELKRKGKCRICKAAIPSGSKSLRYMMYSAIGSLQETGMCLDCARKYWAHIKEEVENITKELEEKP